MIRNFCLISIFFLFPFICYSDDLIISYPSNSGISDYVSCDTRITSIRYDETIIPSYEITLEKKRNNLIKELSIEIIYYYGQNFIYTNRKMFTLDNIEIGVLNTRGQIVLSNTLSEIIREPQIVLENTARYLEPDGEYVSGIFYKLVAEEDKTWIYSTTSFLKEGNVEYSPNNLSSPDGLPWASNNGYGIGDKIIIDFVSLPKDSITIINGFVSRDRPDLFVANSRVKLIKITNLYNERSIIRFVEDSIVPQNIDIRHLIPRQNIKIEIEVMSVYHGARFKDLCIQAIF